MKVTLTRFRITVTQHRKEVAILLFELNLKDIKLYSTAANWFFFAVVIYVRDCFDKADWLVSPAPDRSVTSGSFAHSRGSISGGPCVISWRWRIHLFDDMEGQREDHCMQQCNLKIIIFNQFLTVDCFTCKLGSMLLGKTKEESTCITQSYNAVFIWEHCCST